MNKVILLIVLVLAVFVSNTQAQKLVDVKPYGSKGLYEITPTDDTISVTPKYSASIYTIPVDTTVTLQIDTTRSSACNLVWFRLSADATKRYVNFDTGFTATASDSLAANKKRLWGFVYVGNKYVLMHRSAEY